MKFLNLINLFDNLYYYYKKFKNLEKKMLALRGKVRYFEKKSKKK